MTVRESKSPAWQPGSCGTDRVVECGAFVPNYTPEVRS